jgi:hypothetical protein
LSLDRGTLRLAGKDKELSRGEHVVVTLDGTSVMDELAGPSLSGNLAT